ncbi:MAG: hypothetical protein RIM99_10025 [Cyclobacteriaceae bacterium]
MYRNSKWSALAFILVIVIIILYLYPSESTEKSDSSMDNPTLSNKAVYIDSYLRNVSYYSAKNRMEESAVNIRKAIKTLKELRLDVDVDSYERLESSVRALEDIYSSILYDSLEIQKMTSSFEFVLNNLARTELEISEIYSETNQIETAQIALKYARVHVKNAILFHNMSDGANEGQLVIEQKVFQEMDSLLENNHISPIDYTLTLDKMIDEVDSLLKRSNSMIQH